MSLHDFYLYLKHVEHSSENLEFYLWSVSWTSRSVIVGIVLNHPCRFKNYEANYPKSKDEAPAAAAPIKDLPSLPNDADALSETTYSAQSSVAEIVAGKTPSRATHRAIHFDREC